MTHSHFPAPVIAPILRAKDCFALGKAAMRLNRIKETLVTLACLAVSGIALMAGMWIALDMPPRTTVAPAIAVAEIGVGEVR